MAASKFHTDTLEVLNELRRADAAIDVRRYDLAIELLRQMLKEHPENSAVFYTLARAYLLKKKLSEANWAAREALRLDPQSSKIHKLYGSILLNMPRPRVSEAEAEYRLALALDPMSAGVH